jgi:hypothetical protein
MLATFSAGSTQPFLSRVDQEALRFLQRGREEVGNPSPRRQSGISNRHRIGIQAAAGWTDRTCDWKDGDR